MIVDAMDENKLNLNISFLYKSPISLIYLDTSLSLDKWIKSTSIYGLSHNLLKCPGEVMLLFLSWHSFCRS